jgi:tripartite-type tricarboxylate transporter receptor subunit TctC
MCAIQDLSKLRPVLVSTFVLGAACVFGGQASADPNYPAGPIRIIANTPAGGVSDMAARLIGERLSAVWSTPIVVESIVGAGGNLAASHVARATPDGYTLIMSGEAAIVTNISLYKKMPFDPLKDLQPISQVTFSPNVLVVHGDLPVNSVSELVALARQQPGKLSYGHGGVGFSQHIAGELFRVTAGIDILQVPYRGSAAVMPELIAGRVSMCFCNFATVLPLAREGKLRALAITSLKRSAEAPDLVTMEEAGFPRFNVNSWFGLLAPTGTPPAIINKLHAEVAKALADPDLRARYRKIGMEVIGNSPEEFASVIRTEIPERRKVIEAANIPLQ